MTNHINRKDAFFEQLQLSQTTINNYKASLNSSFLKDILKKEFGVLDIFELDSLEDLWSLYSIINPHPKNVNNHRAFSSAIMRYIRFLNNGKKYGRRIDYKKPKKRKQRKKENEHLSKV